MAEQVQIKDRGWKKLGEFFKKNAKGKSVAVGIQGDEAQAVDPAHGEMTNVAIGAIHEYGTSDGTIPERNHWRSTFDENQDMMQKELDRLAGMTFDDPSQGTIEGGLIVLGEEFKTKVIKKIQNGELQELSERYVQVKTPAGSPPLLKTGQYINSFRAVIVVPGKKREIQ
jgi:hypothetical protein